MKVEEIINDLQKLIKHLETNLLDPQADPRYDYSKDLLKYLKEYKKLKGEDRK